LVLFFKKERLSSLSFGSDTMTSFMLAVFFFLLFIVCLVQLLALPAAASTPNGADRNIPCQMANSGAYSDPVPGSDMPELVSLSVTPDPFIPSQITDEEGAAMFRAGINLFGRWQLTDAQAATLLDLPPRTFARWKAGAIGRLGRDQKARLSNLMGIHKALRIIFGEPARAYDWVRRPNTAFGGRTALEIMLGGELTDLMRVRRYLDAERGG